MPCAACLRNGGEAMKTAGVQFKAKKFFFDRKLVQDLLGKKSAKALGKAGSFVQRRSRSSLRRRKKTSSPGQPPSVHSNDSVATLKNIWFALDPGSLSVVVGPLKLNQGGESSAGTIPALHEFGGRLAIKDSRGRRKRTQGQVRIANYPARPFMQPALEKEAPNFPSLWLRVAG
jgi:hypothetical protein